MRAAWFRMLVSGAADLLWPPRCIACDVATVAGHPLCALCADTLVETEGEPQRLSFPREPAWASAICRYEFGGQLAVAIRRAKYSGEAALARALGGLLGPLPGDVDLVVPVPLHPRRLRERGFNQSAELVRGAGGRPALGILARVRNTAPQSERPRSARLVNVSGAFLVREPRRRLVGRRVLLIDDVMTTGATADACAGALLDGGAQSVDVLALARATD